MSDIMQSQKLGVSQWYTTSCATVFNIHTSLADGDKF